MLVAITGARGFVGTALVQYLRACGIDTVAISRESGEHPDASESRHVARYDDGPSLARAVAGADAVVHLAARVHVMRETATDPLAEFRRSNVAPVRALIAAAREAKLSRLVLFSSAKVYGEGRDTAYAENEPTAPSDAYARSKVEAEQVARGEGADVAWTIIRPPLVYGPGVGGNFRRLLRLADIARRVPLPLGAIHNQRSMVSVENLSSLVLASIEQGAAVRQVFNATDATDVSTTELVRELCAQMGAPARLFPVPAAAIRTAATLLGRGAESDRMLGSFLLSRRKAHEILRWQPPQSVAAGLGATVAWWKGRK